MALQPDPYAALKALLSASPDLNEDNPTGMVHARMAEENNAENDLRRYENASSGPHSYSGASPSTFKKLAMTLGASPNFGDEAQQRVADITSANDKAMQAGFTGDTDIAGPASGGGPQLGEHLYANLGDRSGLSPAQMAGRSASMMESAKIQAPLLAAREKAMGDILAEREKGAQSRQTGAENWKRTTEYMNGQQGPQGQQRPAAPQTLQAVPGQTPAAPKQSQSFMDYIMGTGERPQNSLMSSLNAIAERGKYGIMSTPLAPLIQNESFGNLEQLQAQFPGVRGFSYLLPKLKEHQANFGKGETPDASYNRLYELVGIMNQVENEMGDPRSHAVPNPDGTLKFTQTPASIQRAKEAVGDTRRRFQTAMDQMKIQFPDLQPPISTQGAPAAPGAPVTTAGGGRFTRIPE